MLDFNARAAIAVAVIAVCIPLGLRLATSPWVFLFFFPSLLLSAVVCGFFCNVILGYFLDKFHATSTKRLSNVVPPFAFSTPAAWQAVLTRSQWSHKAPQALPPLRSDLPFLSAAINEILIMIVRDFVLGWYTDISTSPSFPTAVSEILHNAAEQLLVRIESLDLASFIVRQVLPKLTAHVERFRQSEIALRGAGLERHLTQSEELDLLLASRYVGKAGSLHSAVDNLSSTFTKQSEEAHLRSLVDAALPFILQSQDANSAAVRIVAREIVACTVLSPLMELFSDPDFWNRTIDQLAGAAIRQQKLITKVRNIIESQSSSSSQSPSVRRPHSEVITFQTDARHFESFLRSINRCDSLLDARRLKSDITSEIRRTRTLLAQHENEDWINGQKTEDVVAFLDRLYTAKRKVEKRISLLGGHDESHSINHDPSSSSSYNFQLREILTNPSSLSYFMEYMDRRGRSLLVQFWLTVESFKDPLESVDSMTSDSETDPVSDTLPSTTLKEDMKMITNLYFSESNAAVVSPAQTALSIITQKYVDAIRTYAETSDASPKEERKARRSVMLAQRQVERVMDHDFEEFQRSDLWFRAVADLQPKAEKLGATPTPEALPFTAPALQTTHSSSSNSGLFATLVQGFSSDGNRSAPLLSGPKASALSGLSRADSSSPEFTSTSNVGARRHPSFSRMVPPNSRTVSGQTMNPPANNLEILMSPSTGDENTTRAPLFDEGEDGRLISADAEEAQRMEAIQAAVTDIIASENRDVMSTSDLHRQPTLHIPEKRASEDSLDQAADKGDRQSVRSGLRRKGIFDDVYDLPDDDAGEQAVEDDDASFGTGNFEPAAPGDLQLAHEIDRISEKISHLESQDGILDALIRKAELTGDTAELKLLRRSKSALERELRQLRFQKVQYEQQDSLNRLVAGHTRAAIVNATTGEEDGKSVVRYLIEVQQLDYNGTFASGWVVARRYSEFLVMHQRLRDKYLAVRNLEFPGKKLITTLSSSMMDQRRVALEKYLQGLLSIAAVCESEELRAFLSRDSPFMTKTASTASASTRRSSTHSFPGHNLVRTMYRSLTESIDDMIFGQSMLDVMISRLTRQAAEFAGIVGAAVNDEDLVTQALRASGKAAPEETLLQLPGDLKPLGGETSSSSFTGPICDLILAVFELDAKNNWLRRQAIVIILQQVLGDTIERKFRDSFRSLTDEPHLLSYTSLLKDSLWPGGQLKRYSVPRTPEEKAQSRDEANRKLSALLPDVTANMIGRSNARRGARRMFAVLQNRRLNQHIVYTVLDEVFGALFPEAVIKPIS